MKVLTKKKPTRKKAAGKNLPSQSLRQLLLKGSTISNSQYRSFLETRKQF